MDDDLAEAVAVLKFVLDNPDPLFHVAVILASAQDHIIDWLQTVLYVVFRGPPDSGKGTAITASMALCQDGLVLGGASGPYLRDCLGDGRAVGISELGLMLKEKDSQILKVIRNGNRRATAAVGLKVPKGRGWENVVVDTFGFKGMDAHGDLDGHVLGRSLVLDTVQSKSLNVALAAEYTKERLAPVREMLARRAALAKRAGWTADRVEATLHSAEFRRRVLKLFGQVYARHGIACAYLLLINDIFGFAAEADLKKLMEQQVAELSDDAQLLKEVIMDWAKGAGKDLTEKTELLVSAELLSMYNEVRVDRRLPPVTSLTAQLRELGFSTRERDWVPARRNMKGPHRGKAVLKPYQKVQQWQKETEEPPGTVATVAGVAQRDGRTQSLQPVQPHLDDWAGTDDRGTPQGTDPADGGAS